MGLFIAFASAVMLTAAGVSAVLAGGGTTQLVVALAIYAVGTAIALFAITAALDS
jgi:hypothetical protein